MYVSNRWMVQRLGDWQDRLHHADDFFFASPTHAICEFFVIARTHSVRLSPVAALRPDRA